MSRVPTTELDAFAAALVDFLRATRRMRGRFGDDGELSLSQYHLLEPLIGDERLATCELALRRRRQRADRDADARPASSARASSSACPCRRTGAWCRSP